MGFATGIAHSATFIGLSHGVETEDIAIAGSGLYLSSNVGMVAGVSLGNAVYQLSLSRGLQSALQEVPHKDTVRFPALQEDIAYLLQADDDDRSFEKHWPIYLMSRG